LAGTETPYGDPTNDSEPWSVDFETEVNGWDEFLFATGDCSKWLVATKEAVLGGPPTPTPYGFAQRSVIESSVVSAPHTVEMGFRSTSNLEDPLISLFDYTPPDNIPDSPKNCLILHIEDSWAGTGADDRQCVLRQNDGANVYIRKV
jgi:hypothetical protein